jgi:hypothetical protein
MPLRGCIVGAILVGTLQTRSPRVPHFTSLNIVEVCLCAVEIFLLNGSLTPLYANPRYEDNGISANPAIQALLFATYLQSRSGVLFKKAKHNNVSPLWT